MIQYFRQAAITVLKQLLSLWVVKLLYLVAKMLIDDMKAAPDPTSVYTLRQLTAKLINTMH